MTSSSSFKMTVYSWARSTMKRMATDLMACLTSNCCARNIMSVWFVTGVSSGFGLQIALKALEHGHKAIGTVRSRQKAAAEVEALESKGGKVRTSSSSILVARILIDM